MCHVLIIEDEPLIALHIELMLEAVGATSFDVAVTEETAVAAALARPPALITSDVRLVEGTGPQAVTRIKGHLGEVPVIFISALSHTCQPDGSASVRLGKPISEAALHQAFRQLV